MHLIHAHPHVQCETSFLFCITFALLACSTSSGLLDFHLISFDEHLILIVLFRLGSHRDSVISEEELAQFDEGEMALRKLGGLVRVSTKAGLAGGTVYLYYEAGLWKGTDETIENYGKLRKEVQATLDANQDIKKWAEYISSSVSSNVKPYSEAVSNFRKECLDYDLTVVSRPINGVIKPAWNKGITWTAESLENLPENIPKWGATGWQKVQELTMQQTSSETSPAASSKPAVKQ